MRDNKSNNKVVGLHGAIPACNQPVEDIIEVLARLLKDAKKGAITGIAVAYVGRANTTSTFWCGPADHQAMITAASVLWFRMMQVETDEDSELIIDDIPPAS